MTGFTITDAADGARSVYAVDIDGDGDIDVLSASQSDDKIAWYENDGTRPHPLPPTSLLPMPMVPGMCTRRIWMATVI